MDTDIQGHQKRILKTIMTKKPTKKRTWTCRDCEIRAEHRSHLNCADYIQI